MPEGRMRGKVIGKATGGRMLAVSRLPSSSLISRSPTSSKEPSRTRSSRAHSRISPDAHKIAGAGTKADSRVASVITVNIASVSVAAVSVAAVNVTAVNVTTASAAPGSVMLCRRRQQGAGSCTSSSRRAMIPA